ncbi:putative Major facilitator superfamily domain, general substrate transporter [Seiridium cardinale]|uniref:Major facilitator superfamily domain, general substrate transporter n=1 Tax=Seiridium cardinale TaxID=138064 RepID=A0ABR2Y512_9PEZI
MLEHEHSKPDSDPPPYSSAYFLTISVFSSFSGYLYNYYNGKYVFLAAAVIAATARNSIALIVGRARTLHEVILRLGFPGLIAIAASLICLTLALQWGETRKSRSDGSVIACLVLWILLTVAFVGVEIYRATTPRHRPFSADFIE